MSQHDEEYSHLYERRKFIRLRHVVHVWVKPCDSSGTGERAVTNNVSFGGVALDLTERYEPGQTVTLTLEDSTVGLEVSVRGKVMWCEWQPGHRAHETAIALVQLSAQQRENLTVMFGEYVQNERRCYIRLKRHLIVEIKHGRWPVRRTEVGSTLDIGFGGIAAKLNHCYETGERLSLRIFLPGEEDNFHAKGVVRYTAPTNGDDYFAGIEFIELEEKERQRLADFLSKTIRAGE